MLFVLIFLLVFFLLWVVFLVLEPLMEHALKIAAHRTAAFRYRDYLPVALLLLAGVAVTFWAGDGFMDIAERVHADSPQLREIDERTHEWARYTRTAGATRFFNAMTIIGTPVGIAVIVVLISIVLVMRNHWRWAAYLILTSGVGGLLNLLLKSSFQRARPDLAEALRQASGFSFPSGHAMGSVVCFGALSYLAIRALRSWRWRAAAVALCLTIALSIASSRVYLGVHWISDIGAGLCAGLIWVSVTTVAYETFRRIRMIRALHAKR